jgi:hypothetical protein
MSPRETFPQSPTPERQNPPEALSPLSEADILAAAERLDPEAMRGKILAAAGPVLGTADGVREEIRKAGIVPMKKGGLTSRLREKLGGISPQGLRALVAGALLAFSSADAMANYPGCEHDYSGMSRDIMEEMCHGVKPPPKPRYRVDEKTRIVTRMSDEEARRLEEEGMKGRMAEIAAMDARDKGESPAEIKKMLAERVGEEAAKGIMANLYPNGEGGGFSFGIAAGVLGIAFVYLLPTFIAFGRGHRLAGPIAVVNIFLGWTLIVYVGCLALAVWPVRGSP